MTGIQLEVAVIHVLKRNVSKVLTAAGKGPQPVGVDLLDLQELDLAEQSAIPGKCKQCRGVCGALSGLASCALSTSMYMQFCIYRCLLSARRCEFMYNSEIKLPAFMLFPQTFTNVSTYR